MPFRRADRYQLGLWPKPILCLPIARRKVWYMQTMIMVEPKLYRFISPTVTVERVVFLQQSVEFVMKVTSF